MDGAGKTNLTLTIAKFSWQLSLWNNLVWMWGMNEYYAAAGLYTIGFNQMQTDTCFDNFLADNWVMIKSSVHFLNVDFYITQYFGG